MIHLTRLAKLADLSINQGNWNSISKIHLIVASNYDLIAWL